MRRFLLAGLCLLPACGSSPSGPGVPGAPEWLSVVLTREDATVRVEKVEYLSEGLRIVGQVCRPPGAGRFPVLALNHGGFEGLGADWNGGLCVAFARAGYATVESSYRGEDGSQGRVEFCLGEVSDVLNMLAIALAQPYADPQRASMLGLSHGGCITARALERGAAVRAAVDVFGPTEAVSLFRSWQARVAAGDPQAPAYRELIARVEQAAGGPPEAVPAAYAARSPLFFVRDLDAWPGALLVVHGTEDALIPVGQSCALAAAGQDFRAFHLGTLLNVIPSPPDACAGLPVAWRSGPHPGPSWPDRRYLVVHEDVGHDFEGLGGGAVLAEVASFLAAKGR